MNRFLSRREKDHHPHKRQKSRDKSSHQSENDKDKDKKIRPRSTDILAIFKFDPSKKLDKDGDAKIQSMRRKLANLGYTDVEDQQLQYGLYSLQAREDVDKAVELVILFQESVNGVVKRYDPTVEMKGAVNNNMVTCWLDSLLFSMFARLPSFEPILYKVYDDPPKRRLSTLIRLWVNLLRSGKLIEPDITYYLQDALRECGWETATDIVQQDASEAFSFITNILQLPLLTLKMDLYHDGVTDPNDDHKLVNERLLEVAIPSHSEGSEPIRLEDCLENYFNNRVEVKRMLARSTAKLERSNTLSSIRSTQSEKAATTHIEEVELSSPNTPTSVNPPSTPITQTRNRAQSIIRRRLVPEDGQTESIDPDNASTRNSIRKQSLRNEVMVPAWQFFNLIRPSPIYLNMPLFIFTPPYMAPVLTKEVAWYTKNQIPTDASLAAHFSQARPVLGICLKRYSMNEKGSWVRNATYVDIPLEIQLPHFIRDETVDEDGPSMGNFKLSLQSVICHKGGQSLHTGHYISYIRAAAEVADGDSASDRRLSNSSLPPDYPVDKWIKHNDLGSPRVEFVDMAKALKEETPYLLFYQVQPIFDEISLTPSTTELGASPPPAYANSPESPPTSFADSGINIQDPETRRDMNSIDSTDNTLLAPTRSNTIANTKDLSPEAVTKGSEPSSLSSNNPFKGYVESGIGIPISQPKLEVQLTEASPLVSQKNNNPFYAAMRQQEEEKERTQRGYFDGTSDLPPAPSVRLSSEVDRSRKSLNLPEDRRGSVAGTEASVGSAHSSSAPDMTSVPATPSEETTAQRISRAASKFRKSGSKSRPTSSSGENRISTTLNRLAGRSKEQLFKVEVGTKDSIPPIPGLDGTSEPREAVSFTAAEDSALKPPADTIPSRKVSRRGRKQEKYKGIDKEDGGLHHKKGRSVDRHGKQVPDRECTVM